MPAIVCVTLRARLNRGRQDTHVLPQTLNFTSGTASRFVAGSLMSYQLCPFDQTLQTEWISKWRTFNTGFSGTVTPSQPGQLNN
jgi:hypothetical protein